MEQVVVDLPDKRRNRSPERQAPAAPSPTPTPTPPSHPEAHPEPTELAELEEEQGPVLQRPFSSRPDGGVGWVEPDAVLSTFAAAADTSIGLETDALKAQGAQLHSATPAQGHLLLLKHMRSSLPAFSLALALHCWHYPRCLPEILAVSFPPPRPPTPLQTASPLLPLAATACLN